MALNDPPKTLEYRVDIRVTECGSVESELEEKDLEKLESDVKQMAQKILEYRSTLPDQLNNIFVSIISAQRPGSLGFESGSEPGSSGERISDTGCGGTALVEEEKKASEKIRLLKDKTSSNMSAVPTVLKRVKECISRTDELDSYSGIIHPSFKKKKPS